MLKRSGFISMTFATSLWDMTLKNIQTLDRNVWMKTLIYWASILNMNLIGY